MKEAEWQTRKERMDTRPRASQPPWRIIRYRERIEFAKLEGHAVLTGRRGKARARQVFQNQPAPIIEMLNAAVAA